MRAPSEASGARKGSTTSASRAWGGPHDDGKTGEYAGVSFYVDANEQRARAREAERRLIEHSQVRTPKPVSPPSDEEEITSLPPVFRREYGYEHTRDTSAEKRNARFRDQHLYGPPPPPPNPDGTPRVLPPRRFLVPQELANQGVVNDRRYAVPVEQPAPVYAEPHTGMPPTQAYPPMTTTAQPRFPADPLARVEQWLPDDDASQARFKMTPQGIVPNTTRPPDPREYTQQMPAPSLPLPVEALPREMQDRLVGYAEQEGYGDPRMTAPLTPSQKKRLRRKKNRGARIPSPPPFPLQVDQQRVTPNGHAATTLPPPEPNPNLDPGRSFCGHEALVKFRQRGQEIVQRLVCPLRPFPHPNQPHLLHLESASDDGVQIFVGWWEPEEQFRD